MCKMAVSIVGIYKCIYTYTVYNFLYVLFDKQFIIWHLTFICSLKIIFFYFKHSVFRSTFAPYYLGFAVYISNTADKDDGILCYKDPGFTKYTLPDHLTIKCEHSGKYVIYYNERRPGVYYGPDYRHKAFGDLCEVEVYGIAY